MLNARVNRQPISRLARIAIAGSLIAVAAAIAPAQEVFSSLSGRVYDSTDSLLPNVRMVLTSAQSGAKYEIRSDANGRFEFVGLPPGRYTLETELLGFANLRGSLDIGGERVQRDVRLRVGSLRETVTVRLPQPGESASRPAGSQARVGSSYATACGAAAAGGIGGNIRPPSKIGHTAPEYPSRLAAARQPGTVVLDARIGEDGLIREVNTVSATDPEFARAATDAIRQWAFSQTLLNCVPVEVAMRVTVNFLAE
jgi:TonB family protein